MNLKRTIIRKREVTRRTGYSGTTIWREEKADRFPQRVQLSERAVGWYEDEVDAWIRARVRGRAPQPRGIENANPRDTANIIEPDKSDHLAETSAAAAAGQRKAQ
jgi:prophage regulatory protein